MSKKSVRTSDEKRAMYAPIMERIADRLVDGKPVHYNATVEFIEPIPVGTAQQIDAWIDLLACGIAWIARNGGDSWLKAGVQVPHPAPLCPSCGEAPVPVEGRWCQGCMADFEARR